jgi:P27 family predicted phage terminase small subunit
MAKGRKAIPTELKRLRGNPGKRKLNSDEPTPPEGVPICPPFLSKIAKEEWASIIPILQEMKLVSTADGKALAAYCQCYSRWREAEKLIDKHGPIVEEPILNKEGDVVGTKYKKNPACNIAKEMVVQMRAFLSLFGLDPSSRSRLRVGEKKQEKDPLQELLDRKRNRQLQSRPSEPAKVM